MSSRGAPEVCASELTCKGDGVGTEGGSCLDKMGGCDANAEMCACGRGLPPDCVWVTSRIGGVIPPLLVFSAVR